MRIHVPLLLSMVIFWIFVVLHIWIFEYLQGMLDEYVPGKEENSNKLEVSRCICIQLCSIITDVIFIITVSIVFILITISVVRSSLASWRRAWQLGIESSFSHRYCPHHHHHHHHQQQHQHHHKQHCSQRYHILMQKVSYCGHQHQQHRYQQHYHYHHHQQQQQQQR